MLPEKRPRIIKRILSQDGLCCTFHFENETHSISNALKSILAQDPSVTFTGYSVPHPNVNLMTIRVEVRKGFCPVTALRNSLRKLDKICMEMETEYKNALKKYDERKNK